jgi:hypothetical protein
MTLTKPNVNKPATFPVFRTRWAIDKTAGAPL